MLSIATLGLDERLSRPQWMAENYLCQGRVPECTMDAVNNQGESQDAPASATSFMTRKGRTESIGEYVVTLI